MQLLGVEKSQIYNTSGVLEKVDRGYSNMLNRTQNLISKLSKCNWEYIKPRPIIH